MQTAPPPAAISLAVAAPRPRDPPTISADTAAKAPGSTSAARSRRLSCSTGRGRTKPSTRATRPGPKASSVTDCSIGWNRFTA